MISLDYMDEFLESSDNENTFYHHLAAILIELTGYSISALSNFVLDVTRNIVEFSSDSFAN